MTWEKYERMGKRRMPSGVCSIIGNGTLYFRAEGDVPSHVELLYDADGHRIGLRPSDDSSQVAMKVNKRSGQSRSSVCVYGFVRRFDIEHVLGKRYPIHKDGDMLIIETDKPV
jgi:hypothetical protein